MTNNELLEMVSKTSGIPLPIVIKVVEQLTKETIQTVAEGEKVTIKNFGVFEDTSDNDTVKIYFTQSRNIQIKKDYTKRLEKL